MFDDLLGNMNANQRFAKAQDNHDAVDPHEAAEYVTQFMRQAPPEMQQQVLRQYVSQLDPRQRQALAQAMIQHQATPVQNVRDDDDDDMAVALSRSGQSLAQQGGAGGLGGLFGMFGSALGSGSGGMGGMMGGGQQGGMGGMMGGGQQGGGLGDMIGGMLGGQGGRSGGMGGGMSGGMGGMGGMGDQRQQGQDPMGGIGQMLQNPMARAGLVSLAAVIGSQLMNRRR